MYVICKMLGLGERNGAFTRGHLPGLAQDLIALVFDNTLEVERHIKPQICEMLQALLTVRECQ